MKKNLSLLLGAQFLTAFADNAILFTAITLVLQKLSVASWYVPALQGAFLVAFVLFAPWVGRVADARPKKTVLVWTNFIKAGGAGLMLFAVEPLFAYALIGLGAAFYSPAKYGILPEMVEAKALVKANGWIEGSTILAILSGTLLGAFVAEHSISLALGMVVVLYLLSALLAWFISHRFIAAESRQNRPAFLAQIKGLLATPRARFATLGVSLFWAAATVLRVMLIAWAPLVLMLDSTTEIAGLTLFVAIGIAIGAVLAAKLIPLAYLRRARLAAYLMGLVISLLALADSVLMAQAALLLAGICGGLFVVPINATLQEIGHKSIGGGGAVAIQNFFENLAMLLATGLYSLVAGLGADPVLSMMWLGVIVVLATIVVSWNLPRDGR